MRVPLSWLREYADVPVEATGREVGDRLIAAGLEVETVDALGADISGPLVVGRVLDIEELTEFKKPIRYCQVDVGEDAPRGIVCGARNFTVGDVVIVALPGAVLPGGFAIAARQTYGRTSDGMICAADELGLGDDHSGIMILESGTTGADAYEVLGLPDDVLDIAVTADRGYCLSIRGVAREAAIAYDEEFRDPAAGGVLVTPGAGYEVRVQDTTACSVFAAVTVIGLDPSKPSPRELAEKVRRAGMRSISLTVDVTNLVMLELGQPLHAYDRDALQGPIVVRRAHEGERLNTLDGVRRELSTEDLLITDDSGPIGLAGVMGGASTEISAGTTAVVIEAAHFDPAVIARAARRHRLPSEASRRFERGVDPALSLVAAYRAAQLLVEYAGGTIEPDVTVVGAPVTPSTLQIAVGLPGSVTGLAYEPDAVVDKLTRVGCRVIADGTTLTVTPPTWRPDLTDPYDLVEEVARLHGYDAIPSILPKAPGGRGLTAPQRLRRRVGTALADLGAVEVLTYPFVAPGLADDLMLPADDPRRVALRVSNPLSEEEPLLRTTLLPGLFTALRRNLGRGLPDITLYETGAVFRPTPGARPVAPTLPVDRRPTDAELTALFAAVPAQPETVGMVFSGDRERRGWWGSGAPAGWADAVEAARAIGRSVGVELTVESALQAPWHPGRCAAIRTSSGELLGYAGELHPRVTASCELPPRTCAVELDLSLLYAAAGKLPSSPSLSNYPAASQDVALLVDLAVPAAEVEAALRAGAGELLEDLRLFDLYTGEQAGKGRKSLAYALRFRAPDRTLTADEASAARLAAIEEAGRRTGAVVRS